METAFLISAVTLISLLPYLLPQQEGSGRRTRNKRISTVCEKAYVKPMELCNVLHIGMSIFGQLLAVRRL